MATLARVGEAAFAERELGAARRTGRPPARMPARAPDPSRATVALPGLGQDAFGAGELPYPARCLSGVTRPPSSTTGVEGTSWVLGRRCSRASSSPRAGAAWSRVRVRAADTTAARCFAHLW